VRQHKFTARAVQRKAKDARAQCQYQHGGGGVEAVAGGGQVAAAAPRLQEAALSRLLAVVGVERALAGAVDAKDRAGWYGSINVAGAVDGVEGAEVLSRRGEGERRLLLLGDDDCGAP